METLKNGTYSGSNSRHSLIDLEIPEHFHGQLIVFAHGYMGFKDWGAWELLGSYFTARGYGFCKFNFTHNGGTTENGIDFPDLEAFAENSYSKEVYDLHCVLDWLEARFAHLPEICLLGHSRGGGIALLAARDPRVNRVVTLASICSVAQRFSGEDMLADWKSKGVRYVTNQRTKQQLPHHYSQVEDFGANRDRLDIEAACRELDKPVLVIHGENDTSVSPEEGHRIASWLDTDVQLIPGADHVFGASHPWKETRLPQKLEEVAEKIDAWLRDREV